MYFEMTNSGWIPFFERPKAKRELYYEIPAPLFLQETTVRGFAARRTPLTPPLPDDVYVQFRRPGGRQN